MATADNLNRGRDAFRRRAWTDAYVLLAAADRDEPLQPDDLECLATAAYLIGKDAESMEIWTRAHQEFLARGAVARAARCAFWLAFALMHHGERARAGGWITRARELLENAHQDCVEQGYLLLPLALQRVFAGDAAGGYRMFCQAAEIGDRFGDRDLIALARHSRGRILIRMGEIQDGLRLLDEAMIAVDAGEVSPLVMGDIVVENEKAELVGIEVKAAATVNASDFKGLRKLADATDNVLRLGLVLYDGENTIPFGDHLFAAPVSCLWG